MIKDGSDLDVYKSRLQRWSRLSNLTPQSQFDLVMISVDSSNSLAQKLEREIGDSTRAESEGIKVILEKLEEWFAKEEEIDAFRNYKEFEEKRRESNEDLLKFVNSWESLYKKCKDKGDTFSDRVLAFKLIVSSNLNDMDHKLVFREAKATENDGKIFERTKKAIRMFYNAGSLKTLNESNVLISERSRNIDEDLDDENVRKTLIAKGWKAPKRKANEELPYTKWFKCKHCRCTCIPPFKKCACPCSNHKSHNCPKKPDEETAMNPSKESSAKSQISLPISQSSLKDYLNVKTIMFVEPKDQCPRESEPSDEFISAEALLNNAQYNQNRDFECDYKNVVVLKTKYNQDDSSNEGEEGKGMRVIVDSGSPVTIGGLEWFKAYFNLMPKAIRAKLEVAKSTTTFQFGGGERRQSLGMLTVPFYITDDEHQAHMVMIKIELVEAPIGLLLGGKSLDAAEAVMKFGKDPFITLPSILDAGTKIPLMTTASGHYVFHVHPPTPEDDKLVASSSLEENSWSRLRSQLTIAYVISEPNPSYEPLLCQEVLINSIRGNERHKRRELTKEGIIKLHHYFGHCTVERLEKLIKNAGQWKP